MDEMIQPGTHALEQLQAEQFESATAAPRSGKPEAAASAVASNVVPFPTRLPASPQQHQGNAVLLDYLYGIDDGALQNTPSGHIRQLFDYATNSPAARALRCRRRMVARAIDETCLRLGHGARILCIASGHFREAELCQSIRYGNFGEIVVCDSDSECLRVVNQCYGELGIQTQCVHLEQLLHGPCQFAGFDLVYSAGLCDHLKDKACRQLAEQLFRALKPGGKLLLGNLRMRIVGIGFLQGLLDWRPQYRRDEQLLNLLRGVDYKDIAGARVFHDIGHRLAFLEACRYG